MKKLLALILAICLSVTVLAALAEEDDFGYYPDEYPESQVFMSTWVAEDGDWRVEMYGEDGGIKPYIVHRLGDNKEDIWEYAVALDAEDHSRLTAVPFGLHYKQDTVSGNWDVTYYEDGDAVFTINENGCLVWTDLKEDAGKGLEFEKIGDFYGSRWVKDAIFKGAYDPATDTVTADGFFDPDEPLTVTFSYQKDEEGRRVVWTENGVSTPLEYSYRVD